MRTLVAGGSRHSIWERAGTEVASARYDGSAVAGGAAVPSRDSRRPFSIRGSRSWRRRAMRTQALSRCRLTDGAPCHRELDSLSAGSHLSCRQGAPAVRPRRHTYRTFSACCIRRSAVPGSTPCPPTLWACTAIFYWLLPRRRPKAVEPRHCCGCSARYHPRCWG